MPIYKFNDLPEGSGSLSSDDIFLFMDDPSSGGVTKKISLSQISSAIGGGDLGSYFNTILQAGSGIEFVYSSGNNILTINSSLNGNTSTGNIDLHNGGVQNAQIFQFSDPSLQSVITGPTPAENSNAQRLIIQGQRGSGVYEGGDVYLWGGDADTNGGDIKIYAGDADSNESGYGGYINIDAGNGFNQGGNITITAGNSSTQAGNVTITAGNSPIGSGVVYVRTNGGTKQWEFHSDGSIIFPDGTTQNTSYTSVIDGGLTDIFYFFSIGGPYGLDFQPNWYKNSAHTIPATSLPTPNDLVIIDTQPDSGSLTAYYVIVASGAFQNLITAQTIKFTGSSSNWGTINGNVEFIGSSYNNGIVNGSVVYNSNYTQFDNSINKYFFKGQPTTLKLDGTGCWNGKIYYSPIVNIEDGVDYTPPSTGYGECDELYYINGQQTTLGQYGDGCWNNKPYSGGVKTFDPVTDTGYNSCDSNYYIIGQQTTLDQYGDGCWNNVPYVAGGALFDLTTLTGLNTCDNIYYINGQPTTLDSNGNGTWNGDTYIGGILQ